MKKTKISVILLILAILVSSTIIAIPTTIAQAPKKATYAFIGAIPNPAGVNKEVLLHIGIFVSLPSTELGFENLTITVTDPTGSEEILGPYRTDSTGGTGAVFTPTMVGTYTLQSHFPEQAYPGFSPMIGIMPGTIMLESDSEIIELEVQEESSYAVYPSFPLPAEYWTRPIDAQIREWSTVSGNWLLKQDFNLFEPNNDGPESAHILWAKQLTTGGLAGGSIHGMEDGDAYEGKFNDAIILNGRLFYNEGGTVDERHRVVCVDLHTGEEIWHKTLLDNRTVAFGQNLYYDTFNYHGVFDYLWVKAGSTWHAFDPFNGDLVYTMTNVPSGFPVFGPKGEILIYEVNAQNGWMALWNSTNIPGLWSGVVTFFAASWKPYGKTVDATGPCPVTPTTPDGIAGYTWNKTIPNGLIGNTIRILKDRVIGSDIAAGGSGWSHRDTPISLWAISTSPGDEGELIFNTTWQPPPGNLTIGFSTASLEDNVFVLSSKETRQFWGFSLNTGDEIWGPTDSQYYTDAYHMSFGTNFPPDVWGYGTTTIAYGKLFSTNWGGIVYAYDAATGELKWTYEANDPYTEILWGNNWPLRTLFITDGKIYIGHDEHSPMDPKPRGAPTICLDVETGDVVWRIDGAFRQTYWGGRAIIGDSIIATQDTYDQRIYAIGKGPSETTLSIQNDVITHGSTALVKGSVIDISPGTDDVSIAKRFPKGLPAISDEYMSEWMLYVYKQFPRPTSAQGVQVKIEAYDPNGNYQNLGTTTTDSSGNFGFAFEPEVPGLYWITANFEGSVSYYGSQSSTYLQVEPAPTLTTPIEPEPTETEPTPSETEPTPSEPEAEVPMISTEVLIVAVVAVAAVIGVAAFWALRRRR